MCAWLFAYVCNIFVHDRRAWYPWRPEEGPGSLKLEIQAAVSHHVLVGT